MDKKFFKYFIDPLYGPIALDSFLRELIAQPEMQRLREIRLSNINSLLLPGSANISRFEHSIGTAFLAVQLAKRLNFSKKDYYTFVCAALLHDVAITPFGHLMEEGLRYAGKNFDHEIRLHEIFEGTADFGNVYFQIYKGKSIGFKKVLNKKNYRRLGISVEDIFSIKQGIGPLGKLLNGSIDIDNIDNVCRMAFHLGLSFRKELPIEIINGFSIKGNDLWFPAGKAYLLEEWLEVRERLYNILMTNPVDFVAKSMLIEAIRIAILGKNEDKPILTEEDWKLTDPGLMNLLEKYPATTELINRFQTGDFYNLVAAYWIDIGDSKLDISNHKKISQIRSAVAKKLEVNFADILVYIIRDKRYRTIKNLRFISDGMSKDVFKDTLGCKSSKILLGISSAKEEAPTSEQIDSCEHKLQEILGDFDIAFCDYKQHLKWAFNKTLKETPSKQVQLF